MYKQLTFMACRRLFAILSSWYNNNWFWHNNSLNFCRLFLEIKMKKSTVFLIAILLGRNLIYMIDMLRIQLMSFKESFSRKVIKEKSTIFVLWYILSSRIHGAFFIFPRRHIHSIIPHWKQFIWREYN